ncbi:Uncharacterised protein [Mycolicibacterium phlei]|jgi:hypothetical protein|nr:hypothetical protein MPHLCCUG_02494 [Mycolicibacterium phlei]EID14118.1 hypothetical protein MPHLEI_12561 [Mycolicibacterium phlei RIVM601174]KXW62973.1 hypothetical protein MPHL43072_08550 [Mycolicibacterium phlei DSM 43072]KXW73455.1 hypothetical protein MPHL43070_11815 [Mycolicibacterium phlei DSM 43070]KXW78558.1 hypothetical protein JL15_05845 [Mycolicibacterium phlei DSM 43071]VEG09420.1 Uncharacterised protein [Mycobacteroides chelonae]
MKTLLAAVGAGAALAMIGFTVAVEQPTGPQDPAVAQPEITTGQTSTVTGAPTELETSVAVPPFTTAPYTNTTGEVH